MPKNDVAKMIAKLRITDAPLVRKHVENAILFFKLWIKTNPFEWVDYFRGIDFHKEVRRTTLPKGTRLDQFREGGTTGRPKPFLYLCKHGTYDDKLGINFVNPIRKGYRVHENVLVLASCASDICFHNLRRREFDTRSRPGQGVQYIIPKEKFLKKMASIIVA